MTGGARPDKAMLDQAMAELGKGELVQLDRVLAWLREAPRRPAQQAFTAGAERQVAYLIEEAERRGRAKFDGGAIESIVNQREVLMLLDFDLVSFEIVLGGAELSEIKAETARIYHSDVVDFKTFAGLPMRVVPGLHGAYIVPRDGQIGHERGRKV